jgi:hypothetical protein
MAKQAQDCEYGEPKNKWAAETVFQQTGENQIHFWSSPEQRGVQGNASKEFECNVKCFKHESLYDKRGHFGSM